MIPLPPRSTLFPYTTLFRSGTNLGPLSRARDEALQGQRQRTVRDAGGRRGAGQQPDAHRKTDCGREAKPPTSRSLNPSPVLTPLGEVSSLPAALAESHLFIPNYLLIHNQQKNLTLIRVLVLL